MLNFLRKLRHKEMNQSPNRPPGRYLKYAIGEIFLVMIGILLAIQVSNWNQSRKDHQREAMYYCQLLEDVEQDQLKMEVQLEVIQNRLASANALIAYLQQDEIDMAELALLIGQSVASNDFKINVTTSTFEDIKSSGNIHLLRDLELKMNLIAYLDNMEGLLNNINTNNASMGSIRFFKHEDLISSGWVELAELQGGLNHDVIDLEELRKSAVLTKAKKLKLMNDAVFYIGINSRNRQHFDKVKVEIEQIKGILSAKCNNQ
jgi:Family of unknown function (DUF6090)